MIDVGKMRDRIKIRELRHESDTFNVPIEVPRVIAERYAFVDPDEPRESVDQSESIFRPYTVTIRYPKEFTLTLAHDFEFDGRILKIASMRDPDEMKETLIVECVENLKRQVKAE